MHCAFGGSGNPIILRESCWREATFHALSAVSFQLPILICLQVCLHVMRKLLVFSFVCSETNLAFSNFNVFKEFHLCLNFLVLGCQRVLLITVFSFGGGVENQFGFKSKPHLWAFLNYGD